MCSWYRIADTFTGADFERAQAADRILGTAYSVLFDIAVILILFNLVIAVMSHGFSVAAEEHGDAYWCSVQYSMIQDLPKKDGDIFLLRVVDLLIMALFDAVAWLWNSTVNTIARFSPRSDGADLLSLFCGCCTAAGDALPHPSLLSAFAHPNCDVRRWRTHQSRCSPKCSPK